MKNKRLIRLFLVMCLLTISSVCFGQKETRKVLPIKKAPVKVQSVPLPTKLQQPTFEKSRPFPTEGVVVDSSDPSKVALNPGGRPVVVTLQGRNLQLVTSAQVLLNGQPSKGIISKVGPETKSFRTIGLLATEQAQLGSQYTLRLIADKPTVDVSANMLIIIITDRTVAAPSRKPRLVPSGVIDLSTEMVPPRADSVQWKKSLYKVKQQLQQDFKLRKTVFEKEREERQHIALQELILAPVSAQVDLLPSPETQQLQIVRLSGQEGEPGDPIGIYGSGFTDSAWVVFTIASGKEVRANIVRRSPYWLIVNVPDVAGVAEPYQGQVIVKRPILAKKGIQTASKPFCFKPQMVIQRMKIIGQGKHDIFIPSGGENDHKYYVHDEEIVVVHNCWGSGYGEKDGAVDKLLKNYRLVNNWRVKRVNLNKIETKKAGVTIGTKHIGTNKPYVKTKWWAEGLGGMLKYAISIDIEGPKGVPNLPWPPKGKVLIVCLDNDDVIHSIELAYPELAQRIEEQPIFAALFEAGMQALLEGSTVLRTAPDERLYDNYDRVIFLVDRDFTGQNIMRCIRNLAPYCKIDIHIMSHGAPDYIKAYGDDQLNANWFASLQGMQEKMHLRSVYQQPCYAGHLISQWRLAGAKVVNGTMEANMMPDQYFAFLDRWLKGETFEAATNDSWEDVEFWWRLLYEGMGHREFVWQSKLKIDGDLSIRVTSQ